MDARLQSVDFADSSGVPLDGLVSVSNPPAAISTGEDTVLRQAAAFPDVTYVFFRRFSDGRSSHPAAFVVDNGDEHLDNAQLAKLHNDLWLHGVAPLVYVAWPTRIDILSCARGPDFWQSDERIYQPAAQLEVASTIESELAKRRRFSAFRLADGTFWEEPLNRVFADHEKAAHESLIQAIVETDQSLDGDSNPVLRRLLLLMVLIKYLEDREVFPGAGWFGRFHTGARTFFDVLKSGEPDCVLRLLRYLEKEKFNGDVFALPEGTTLTKTSLRQFAKLVEAKTIKQQRYLWEQYSFSHLPVEVISHLYQRFVKGSTAVYTPPFLAALLLDYAMPYEKLSGKERVLDPACGSGVFLVGAFRRLVAVHRSKSKNDPTVDTLKSILKNQIFGVETDPTAIDLTAFSLALAICDSLQPNVIWNELRFDRLRDENLIETDFFDLGYGEDAQPKLGRFDVVIGNPPFESEFSEPAARVNKARTSVRGAIPDKQIAYLFVDVAAEAVKENGTLCLIQPSGFLYNVNSHAFRSAIANSGRLRTVLDFTSIRGLYEGADPKTIAVLLSSAYEGQISHLTFRRTYETAQRIGFELDHYDSHKLTADQISVSTSVARANLLGGGRLSSIATRFREMRSLSALVGQKSWLMGEGFIVGNRKNPALHLTGKPLLPTSALSNVGFDHEALLEVTETHFEGPRKPDLFQPPLLLIKEHDSLPVAFWDRGPLAFKHKIIGIHAPRKDATQLRALYETILKHRETLRFAVALNGSQALVGKATAVLKSDIERLPIPENSSELGLTFWEAALAEDTLSQFAEYVRVGQNSPLLKRNAGPEEIRAYSELFVKMLGSIYDNLRSADPIFLNGLICQPFFFGDEPAIEWLGPDCEEQLTNLIFDESRDSLRTVRVVRYYHENVIFIVKPDRLRYWIKSTAIRDADDTLIDLQRQGY